jgi:P-type Cu2+ transporter
MPSHTRQHDQAEGDHGRTEDECEQHRLARRTHEDHPDPGGEEHRAGDDDETGRRTMRSLPRRVTAHRLPRAQTRHPVPSESAVPLAAPDDHQHHASGDERDRQDHEVEADSEHPLARAIRAHAATRIGTVPTASGFRSLTGRGVEASIDGATVTVGGPTLLTDMDVAMPADLESRTSAWSERGAAVLHVLRDGVIVGAIALEDEVRDVSRSAVSQLHAAGVSVMMITGDAWPVARAVAAELGIDEVFAEVLPEHKAERVTALQARGLRVAMVGDGVNDAPALASADVGIAIGAGTDVAIASAGIVLASDDPRSVMAIRRLSAATYRKMLQNLWWAAGYNIVAIPLAAGVLAGIGFVLPMALGAALMSTSTIIVALNAQLLRRTDLSVDDRRGASEPSGG